MSDAHTSKQLNVKIDNARSQRINPHKNDPFPIHVNFGDKEADFTGFNRDKPDGTAALFTKGLYDPSVKVDITSDVMPQSVTDKSLAKQESEKEETMSLNFAPIDDSKYPGFVRTEKEHREVYK